MGKEGADMEATPSRFMQALGQLTLKRSSANRRRRNQECIPDFEERTPSEEDALSKAAIEINGVSCSILGKIRCRSTSIQQKHSDSCMRLQRAMPVDSIKYDVSLPTLEIR
ncbi:hypothetical protein KIN20_032118 [Parelaphostrongylus tenuis]|uniref:Uncharacterized protein n=1 Tax=Parelaphostrongylus tenuis TaxID=148309 RepID=A0AAD5R6H8_PARTN|nr:hypothetical protein KIN20_032118 [Parelaphostrongylus tenuis]